MSTLGHHKDEPHYYLYADGYWTRDNDRHRWHVFRELPRFQPDYAPPDVFQELVNGEKYQKLLCKLGTRGNHAAMHFDQGRNTIVLLTGMRRYLLAPPSMCSHFDLLNLPHPSARHSKLNFEDASSWKARNRGKPTWMNEVVMEPGDVLILPSYWFHSVVLLEEDSMQCNGWSTSTTTYRHFIEQCGNFLNPSS